MEKVRYVVVLATRSTQYVLLRVRPRFFDEVGHETMYASSGNKHMKNIRLGDHLLLKNIFDNFYF